METSAPLGLRAPGAPSVVEDEIDQYLSRQDGKIYRSRDPQLCRHGPLGKCVHCVPLEPFDEDYLHHLEPPVKHMSFHAYIRKLTGGADKGKFVALENISCKIKSGCEGHLPWPNGICTKCQPSAITLNRQKYRHVDNIMFENHTVADRFLDFWRKTGAQHVGYLYGRYTEHKDIPLGIRAEVAAIYEPPQIGTQNSLELLEDPKAEVVDEIAAKLGLRKCVGAGRREVRWPFPQDTYFLSSEECITAGAFQNKHPNICRLSPDGHFGSKFVTAVATGGPDNQVHFEGYQVSNQCMALVRDECLLPCRDAPELGYAKESSSEQYVPDVFYKDIDKFGNEITQLARPLPVEYLIIDITTTFPKDPVHTFSIPQNPFPIENRDVLGETQDFHSLATYLSQNTSSVFLDTVSDFHLLLFLVTNEVMPLQRSGGLTLEEPLFGLLFGADASILQSPVILCGLPGGQLRCVVLKALVTSRSAPGDPAALVKILHHLEEPVVFIGALRTEPRARDTEDMRSDCLVAVGHHGRTLAIKAGRDEAGRPVLELRDCRLPGPVLCAASGGDSRVYQSTPSGLRVLDLGRVRLMQLQGRERGTLVLSPDSVHTPGAAERGHEMLASWHPLPSCPLATPQALPGGSGERRSGLGGAPAPHSRVLPGSRPPT
ncbi:PREDICTED: nuclear protein localization protein 4 homolog [Condylura cristata]|uniref:nuclear protein localization protein 4 homolog n=1 Tax=Condylura cristata TaxID=143302 RepID=UPI00064356A5|nr:PREDICTED: nuclear protein localization protein 4 homolog [Condylura cristata]